MSELTRLPNGTWILPEQVTEIAPHAEERIYDSTVHCHVNVAHAGHHIRLLFSDFVEACSYADLLADIVNERKRAKAATQMQA